MTNALRYTLPALLIAIGTVLLPAPGSAAGPEPPLALEASIPLPEVKGRIDHMAADLKRRRLIIAELGNDTVDVVDLIAGKVLRRLSGLSEPQGIGFSAWADLIFVADAGDGSVRLFRGEDLAPLGGIVLGEDADNVRINPHNRLVVVGFGTGGLALIDPMRRALVAEIRLPAHPESFRIDPEANRAFVNLPDAGRIAVVDLDARRVVESWRIRGLGGNFPMALDPASDLLAVVFRNPPTLVLLDRRSGIVKDRATTCGDADDVFFDGRRRRVYISCGAGAIASFQMNDGGVQRLPSIAATPGARTSLFVPDLDRLFVAQRAGLPGAGAAVLVYRPVP